jgi:hypothetical protein
MIRPETKAWASRQKFWREWNFSKRLNWLDVVASLWPLAHQVSATLHFGAFGPNKVGSAGRVLAAKAPARVPSVPALLPYLPAPRRHRRVGPCDRSEHALAYKFVLPTANHVFLPGHRIMVQMQSSWFPLYDRNPQTVVPTFSWPSRGTM